jgi:cyclopropane-fatty-acyl-phospholipid synthase
MHSGVMSAPTTIQGHPDTAASENRRVLGGPFSLLFEKTAARLLNNVLHRMDQGLNEGMLQGELPNGTPRVLGGRAPGPVAIVRLNSWLGLWRVATGGSIGLYRAWEKGEWESPDLVQLCDLFVRNRVALGKTARASGVSRVGARILAWMRRNDKAGARRNIEFHYDLGNEFYREWLDPSLTYSSALFAEPINNAESLEVAQNRKIAVLLDRLDLTGDSRLLEIGCGWGSLAQAALARGIGQYHGITLSSEQKAIADARLELHSARAAVTLTDYRDVDGQYDAIASVEMVEAVGQEFWPEYIQSIANVLRPGGKAAIQYIRIEDDVFDAYARSVDFIQAYVFPGGMLLSESRFRTLAKNAGLVWQDQVDFGQHYAETLRRWRLQFDTAVADGRLPPHFDQKFIRLWRYYLMYCEGGFRGGGINVAQVTLIKK